MKKRISFDSLTLFACLQELRKFVGYRVQRFSQIEENAVAMEVFNGNVGWIVFGWDVESFRVHEAIRPYAHFPRGELCKQLFVLLNEAVITSIKQIGSDRVAHLVFESPAGLELTLVLELMGKHGNFMLLNHNGVVQVAGKYVGPKQSRRPVLPMQKYVPAFEPSKINLWNCTPENILESEGCSPYLKERLTEGLDWSSERKRLKSVTAKEFPAFHSDRGIHPIKGSEGDVQIASIGLGLQKLYEERYNHKEFEQIYRLLKTQLDRAILARETSMAGLIEAEQTAHEAPKLQLFGDLILAYQGMVKEGDSVLDAFDYEGIPVQIPLNPDFTAKENAQKLFSKAKKAKNRLSEVEGQKERIGEVLSSLKATLSQVIHAQTLEELKAAQTTAQAEKWLIIQATYSKDPTERPFEGHSIKVHFAPKGYEVLVGENAESNDYLTLRIAKASDWWLHVRGGPSAHVIIKTNGKPEQVPKEVLEFAAVIAVRNSPQKHSSYVPVDYTQKRYVRRTKGGKAGLVQYTHEKTLHVNP